jgi:aspartate aminotransferase-like enzyme
VTPKVIKDGLKKRGIMVAGGLGPYSVDAIRIGHMGDIRVSDVERTCDAIEDVLAELR